MHFIIYCIFFPEATFAKTLPVNTRCVFGTVDRTVAEKQPKKMSEDDSVELNEARNDSGIDYDEGEVESVESVEEIQNVSDTKQLTEAEKAYKRKLLDDEEEANRLQEIRQKESLEALKLQSDGGVKEKRLEFLMAQSEVFTSFLMGGGTSIGKAMGAKKSKAKSGGANSPNRRGQNVDDTADNEAMMAMEESRYTKLTVQPKNIVNGTMRPFQLEGLNWMIRLHDCHVNGILADEMGLGKTLQTISLLAYLREARGMDGPHMIIVPKSTVGNWIKELHRWCPSIRAFRFMGNKEERAAIRNERNASNFDVCVLSYEICIIEFSWLKKFKWQYLIIDEAHRIKNEHSKLSNVVRQYKVQHRLLITGTPLQNNLHELWALLNFLLPDVFSNSEDFDVWFNIDAEEGQQNVIKKLHTILRPFLLRRLKVDVAHGLPPKTETKLYVGITEMQRAWYTRVLQKDATHLNAIGGSDRVRLLNILMQLRKVCNHPYLFDGAEPTPFREGSHLWDNCGKLILLGKLLPRLKAQGSRVLLFCQMTRMLDILEDYVRYFNYDYCRLDGSTKGEARDSMITEFNEPGSSKFCFLLSTRAGGLGINLATADIVILYDSDWNPQVDLQAMDRAHRIGQTKPVRVFRLISEGTVEEKIVEKAERKLYLDAAVIQQGRLAEQNRKLSKDDLMSMVRFGADEIFNAKGSTVTDEDIDAILAKGEERTEEMKSRIDDDMQHNLKNFTLNDEGANLYQFEGESFRDGGGKKTLPATFIALPQRERKKNYDLSENNRRKSGTKSNRDPKLPKIPIFYDYQFFNQEKIVGLAEIHQALECKKRDHLKLIREAKSEEAKLRRSYEKDDNTVTTEEVDSATALVNSLESKLPEFEMNQEDGVEYERLKNEGFGDMTRRDFREFVASCERHGRQQVTAICEEVAQLTGKTPERYRQYYYVFWNRYKELKDFDKHIEKIERGEKKLEKNESIRKALEAKCSRYSDPWRNMIIPYPPQSRSRGYTMDEDVFLVCLLNKYGYDSDWDVIKSEIRNAWQFRFDWFFKSRSVAELQKRGEYLTRMIEKENADLVAKRKNEERALKDKLKAEKSKKRASSATKPLPVCLLFIESFFHIML